MIEKDKKPSIRFKGFIDDWKQYNWEETVDISTNMVDPKTGKYDELFHIGPGNIESFSGKLLDNIETVKDSNLISGKFYFRKGDIIYGKINPQLAKYTIAPFEGLASADSYVLSTQNGIDQNYLYAILQTNDFYKYSVSVSARTGIPKINRDELNIYNFFAPSMTEQQKIGELLIQLDKLILLHQRKYDKFINIKKAMLEKMFPKDGSNVPKIRFKGFDDDWKQCKLHDIVDIVGGGTPSTSNPEYWDGEIDWYSPTEIGEKVYAEGSIKRITELGLQKSSAKVLPANKTILFTSRASIGDMAILKRSGATNQGFQSLIVKDKNNPYFVYSMGHLIKQYALKNASGSTFLEISGKQLGAMDILIPDENEQNQISEFFKQLDNYITLHKLELENLKNIKKACLDKMFL